MPPIKVINRNTLYLNAGSWRSKLRDSTLNHFKEKEFIIIDTRNYSTEDFISFSKYLIPSDKKSVTFMYSSKYPGLLHEVVNPTQTSPDQYFKGMLIVLLSEKTKSRAEYLSMLLKTRDKNIIFIGRSTYGADGDISTIPLIGDQGLVFTISGLRVLFTDGTETQGLGIKPDIQIDRNISDIMEDCDRILLKALELTEHN